MRNDFLLSVSLCTACVRASESLLAPYFTGLCS